MTTPARRRILERDVAALEQSLGPLPEPRQRPPLLMLSGLPGSGKSHIARLVLERYPMAHVESDRLRRVIVPAPTHSPLESARLFAALHELADRLLERGVPVLLDATNLKEDYRRPVYRIAERRNARLVIVRAQAPDRVVRRRLAARAERPHANDNSDAGIEVYEKMRAEEEPLARGHTVVDTSGNVNAAVDKIVMMLRGESS